MFLYVIINSKKPKYLDIIMCTVTEQNSEFVYTYDIEN